MSTQPPAVSPTRRPGTLDRAEIPEQFRWNLADIYPGWAEWEADVQALDRQIDEFAALQGTLANGAPALLAAYRLREAMGRTAAKVSAYAALAHDEDQRVNAVTARRQQVDILFARWMEASAWFNPELLQIPLETVRQWMAVDPALALYRFAIEDLHRQQEHVLDEAGERLLSLAARVSSAPTDAYSSLSTADIRFPTLQLADGSEVVLTYGQYRSILATNRHQPDRAQAFRAMHELYAANQNTYAALYDGVLQRDRFHAKARRYPSTLEAALHGDNIPASVVENLIAGAKAGVEPLRRYHRLRRRVLGLESYHVYDGSIPLVDFDKAYDYQEVLEWLVDSVSRLGSGYVSRVRQGLTSRWIDVYENHGKRSGAYSFGVYGVHPYMLLNYNDTLDAVFTLAHEMGHTMHTILSDEHQPYIYSRYTIFVAEVPSTLSEALLLEYMLARSTDPRERIVLLQHAIDNIVGTFYTQVVFADYELQAHRYAEQGRPITADALGDLYYALLQEHYGDCIDYDELSRYTWARIPHFYNYSFYVYQYATCFASSAELARQMNTGNEAERRNAVDRYLTLLKSGGSDYPMAQLLQAGVDLRRPEPVQAVVEQLDSLVTRLEQEILSLPQER